MTMNIPQDHRLFLLPTIAMAILLLVTCADAAAFVVDRNDDDASALACTNAPDDCSLRGAIAASDAVSSDDVISFDPAVFGSNNVVLLSNGTLRVTGNGKLLIDGSAARFVTIDGQGKSGSGIFLIEAVANVTVSNLTMTGGNKALQAGGAVENRGRFILSHSTVSGNRGGAGGAIYNYSGNLSIDNSTICFNQSAYGAVHNVGTAAMTVIRDSTICSNSATYGGGIYVSSGSVSIGNSIVANNTASLGPDVYHNVNSLGYNLFGNTSGMTVSGTPTGDQSNLDPLLDPSGLADHGGNSSTVALLQGSPALDKGNSFATDDQRNATRPMDDPDSADGSGNLADIGAYEFTPVLAPPPDPVPKYEFGGFLKPISSRGINPVTARGSVPVKFSLNGFQGFDLFAEGYPASQEISCSSGEPLGDPVSVVFPGNSGLEYDETSDVYGFRWKTDREWAGTCRRLVLLFNDGSVHTADFSFK